MVESIPPGAAVLLDGDYQGRTQNNNPLDITGVEAGNHVISIQLENYRDYDTSVAVAAGQTTTVQAELEPSPSPGESGIVQINSVPGGANIFIDNVCKGITPLTIPSIETGSYSILIRLEGYNDYSSTFTVNAGQAIQIEASLTPRPTPAGSIPFGLVMAIFLVAIWIKRTGP